MTYLHLNAYTGYQMKKSFNAQLEPIAIAKSYESIDTASWVAVAPRCASASPHYLNREASMANKKVNKNSALNILEKINI